MSDEFGAQISAAIAGDRKVLTHLLEQYAPELRPRIKSRIGKAYQALLDEDDVAQITFTEVFLRIGEYKARGADEFFAWLTRTAENNVRDAIKGLTRKKRLDPRRRIDPQARDDDHGDALDAFFGGGPTPSQFVRRDERAKLLRGALKRLPKDYRRAITGVALDGRTIEEVASEMHRSVGAVYMLLARARDRLRESLPPESQMISS